MEEVFEGLRSALAYNQTLGTPNIVGLRLALGATVTAIDWRADWVFYVLCTHLLLWVVFFFVRTHARPLVLLFAAVIGLDSAARQTWTIFSKREHYATNFVLLRLLWTTPLLFMAFVILVYSLVDTTMSARSRMSRSYKVQRHIISLNAQAKGAQGR